MITFLRNPMAVFLCTLVLISLTQLQPVSAQDSASRTSDLTMFRTQFLERDNSYSTVEKAEAERLLMALEAAPEALSDAAFQLELAKIAALAGNAHTTLFNPQWTQTFNRIDLQFFIGGDGLFIGGARGDLTKLKGWQVHTLEGRTLDELRTVWDTYQSGRQGWRDEFLPYFLESPEILHAAGIAASPEQLNLVFDDGTTLTVRAGTKLEPLSGFSAFLPPSRAMVLAHSGFVPDTPLYLQDPEKLVRHVYLPDHDAVYIQFRSNADFSGEINVRQMANDIADELLINATKYVILDQRHNPGGDLNNTRRLMQALPEIVGQEGHIFVLVSGRTFSAGISSVGYAKQAGKDQVTIIGTPPGDDMEFWAEGDVVFLPGAQTGLLYSTERHNYTTGCQEADCHGSIRNNPIRVASLDPDIFVPFRYEDLAAGRDPLLDMALRKINERE